MKRIPYLMSLVLFVFIICGQAQTPLFENVSAISVQQWQEFRYAPGNFAVTMPGEPKESSQSLDTEIGKVPLQFFTTQNGQVIYMVMFVEYPIVFDTPAAAKTALENGRDMMLIRRGAKLISEKEIS